MTLLPELTRVLLLSIHLLANALAGGGPIVATLLPLQQGAGRRVAWFSVWAMAVGLLSGGLGVLLVLAGCCEGYEAAAARLPGRAYAMLAAEWAFTAVLYLIYVLLWDRLAGHRFWRGLIAVVAATNLLYHFPTMMIVLAQLADEPTLTNEPVVSRSVFRELLLNPAILGRTLHFWSLSLLTAGLCAMISSAQRTCRRVGAIVALAGVGCLFVTGVAILAQSSASQELLGFDSLAGWCFQGGVVCGLVLTTLLSFEVAGRRVGGLTLVLPMAVAVLLMTLAATLS